MKRVATNLLATALSIALSLGLAELALRVLDYPPSTFSPWVRAGDTGYQYAPSIETRMTRHGEYDVAFATNSLGLRDDEVGPKRNKRMLLLGDSFTSGYGVERGETFADLLEDRLGVDVVNAGVGGYELVHQVHYYRSRGSALDPDLVVLVLYLGNDLSRNGDWHETEDGGLVAIERTFPLRAKKQTKLVQLYRQLRYQEGLRREQQRGPWQPFPDYLAMCQKNLSPDAEASYDEVARLLGRLRDLVVASGARLFVVLLPYVTAVDEETERRLAAKTPDYAARYDLSIPNRRVSAMLDRLGIAWLDLTPGLRSHYAHGGAALYFEIDGHLNVAGNRLVAGELEPALRAELLDSPPAPYDPSGDPTGPGGSQ